MAWTQTLPWRSCQSGKRDFLVPTTVPGVVPGMGAVEKKASVSCPHEVPSLKRGDIINM